MQEKLKLKKAINTLSGEEVNELLFDFTSLTAKDYLQITRLENRLRGAISTVGEVGLSLINKKVSPEFHISTAWIAALKATPNLCLDDIDSITLLDLLKIGEIGSNFILLGE